MADNGETIKVIIDTSDLSVDEEMKSKERFVLGYVLFRGRADSELKLTVFIKRNPDLQWEAIKEYTLTTNTKRFFKKLPPSISCIDAYIRLEGDVGTFDLTALKLYVKPIRTGQYG